MSHWSSLAAGGVHVWVYPSVSEPPAACLAWLDHEERKRAAAYYAPAARRLFVGTRVALRTLLAAYLHTTPQAINLVDGEFGKPMLATPSSHDLHFNVSHSDDIALIAIARDRAVGVDVEAVRPLPELDALARRFFAPRELAALMALPEPDRVTAFYRVWTRKEAWIKLTGLGLQQPLDRFAVAVGERAALTWVEGINDASRRWWLGDLSMLPGYAATLAVAGTPPSVTPLIYPDDLTPRGGVSRPSR